MHFGTKSYLKSNRYHIAKHVLNYEERKGEKKIFFNHISMISTQSWYQWIQLHKKNSMDVVYVSLNYIKKIVWSQEYLV
jgi:hypothetical protein